MRYVALTLAVSMLGGCDTVTSPVGRGPGTSGMGSAVAGDGSGGNARFGSAVRGTPPAVDASLPAGGPWGSAGDAAALRAAVAAKRHVPFEPKPADEADVCEAVFRHLLEKSG